MLFKTIPNKESKRKTYQVSRDGTALRSVDKKTGEVTKLGIRKRKGYMESPIGPVHQLVAETFVPKPEEYDETFTVDHLDKDPTNNHASNLFWKSKSDQAKNRRKKSRTQITSKPVIAMKDGKVIHTFESIADVSKIGAHQSIVSLCILGTRKTHMGMTWTTPPSDPDLPDEEWKEVGKNNKNMVLVLLSTLGRVGYLFECGYFKKVSSTDKNTERATKEIDKYPSIQVNGKGYKLHRLMWTTFVGPIPVGMQVNHIDHNKQNAALANLELVTPSVNMKKAHDAGRLDGTKCQRKHVVIDDKEYESVRDAAKKTGIPRSTIQYRIENGIYAIM